jgi:hypothetical protein
MFYNVLRGACPEIACAELVEISKGNLSLVEKRCLDTNLLWFFFLKSFFKNMNETNCGSRAFIN